MNGKYIIEKGSVLRNAYILLCLFFASKEIARRTEPNDGLRELEDTFFGTEVSRLLIEIAISIRVFDDQMLLLPKNDPDRNLYFTARNEADKYHSIVFNDTDLDFRGICNKIIHSEVFEPHSTEGEGAHEKDFGHRLEDESKNIHWKHLSGLVRLKGKDKGKEWYVLLDIEMFVKAIFHLFSN